MAKAVKQHGRVYTPDYLVKVILDFGGYDKPIILKKHVIDNYCTDDYTFLYIFDGVGADEVRASEGTGLGLSIAKWIVDKHGGYFEILSREELGTRIRIQLP